MNQAERFHPVCLLCSTHLLGTSEHLLTAPYAQKCKKNRTCFPPVVQFSQDFSSLVIYNSIILPQHCQKFIHFECFKKLFRINRRKKNQLSYKSREKI